MGIEVVAPGARGIFTDGTPEVAGELLIVNVAVGSATVAVTVVSVIVFVVTTS